MSVKHTLVGGNNYEVHVVLRMEAVVTVTHATDEEHAKQLAQVQLAKGRLENFELKEKPSAYDVISVKRI